MKIRAREIVKIKFWKLLLGVFLFVFMLTPSQLFSQDHLPGNFDSSKFVTDPYMSFSRFEDAPAVDYELIHELKFKPEDIISNPKARIQVEDLVSEVYRGFKSLYPRWMQNKEKPQFAFETKRNNANAAAIAVDRVRSEMTNTNRGLMLISEEFISRKMGREAQLTLIAHEMAHLYLFHSRDDFPQFIRIENIPEVFKQDAEDFVNLTNLLGGLHHPIFNGISNSIYVSRFYRMLEDTETDECKIEMIAAKDAFEKFRESILSMLREDWSLDDETTLVPAIIKSRNVLRGIQSCLNSSSATYRVSFAPKHRELLSKYGIGNWTAEDESFEFQIILNILKQASIKTNELKKNLLPYSFKVYTSEDQADEVAASVVKRLNYSAEVTGQLHLSFFKEPSLENICKNFLSEYGHTYYGNVYFKHHAQCWRYKRHLEFYKTKTRVDGLE